MFLTIFCFWRKKRWISNYTNLWCWGIFFIDPRHAFSRVRNRQWFEFPFISFIFILFFPFLFINSCIYIYTFAITYHNENVANDSLPRSVAVCITSREQFDRSYCQILTDSTTFMPINGFDESPFSSCMHFVQDSLYDCTRYPPTPGPTCTLPFILTQHKNFTPNFEPKTRRKCV